MENQTLAEMRIHKETVSCKNEVTAEYIMELMNLKETMTVMTDVKESAHQ